MRIAPCRLLSPGLVFSTVLTLTWDIAPSQAVESPDAAPLLPISGSAEESGFRVIFNGDIQNEWQGNPTYWRVEQGLLVGEVTAQNNPAASEYLIWRRGITKDFELKIQYKISAAGNTGVSYRSRELPNLALSGYQADIDGPLWGKTAAKAMDANTAAIWSFLANIRVTGGVYEEHGRQFLAMPGQFSYLAKGRQPQVLATLGSETKIDAISRDDGWNEYYLIARGPVHIHLLNGRVVSLFIDDDVEHRRSQGKLGLQIHPGPPMKVAFRNIRIKNMD